MTKRAAYLLLLMLLIGAFALWDQGLLTSGLVGSGGGSAVAGKSLSDRLAHYQKYLNSSAEIQDAYFRMVPSYVERMTQIGGFMVAKQEDAGFVKDMLMGKLDQMGLYQLVEVNVGASQDLGNNIRKVVADIQIQTDDSESALAALYALGMAEDGFLWDSFTLKADKEAQNITLAGQAQILIVEAAE